MKEVLIIEDDGFLLDLFYMILKFYGLSYQRYRTAWLRQRQLDLFSR